MSFLILVIAIVVLHQRGTIPAFQPDGWLRQWQSFLDKQSWLAKTAATRLFCQVFLPALILVLLSWLVGGWLWGLAGNVIALLVLLYSLGRDDVQKLVTDLQEDLSRADVQAAVHDTENIAALHDLSEAENWQQLQNEAIQAVAYRYFERYFPVLFWFVALGAPGALLYRLAFLFRQQSAGPEAGRAIYLLWLLEWLPLRLIGLLFALVGSFSSAIQAWRESFWDVRHDTGFWLGRYVSGALGLSAVAEDQVGSVAKGAEYLTQVTELFDRALVMALAIVAIFALL